MEALCKIRDLYRAIAVFEANFEKTYKLCLNEGMLLCTLSKVDKLSSSQIAEMLSLTTSNASKVIKSAEDKGFIKRLIGDKDKRQMYFLLTKKGKDLLLSINCDQLEMSDLLRSVL